MTPWVIGYLAGGVAVAVGSSVLGGRVCGGDAAVGLVLRVSVAAGVLWPSLVLAAVQVGVVVGLRAVRGACTRSGAVPPWWRGGDSGAATVVAWRLPLQGADRQARRSPPAMDSASPVAVPRLQ